MECPWYDEYRETIEGNSSRVERRSIEKILKLEVAKDGEAENYCSQFPFGSLAFLALRRAGPD
jgi:hypothetical protein